MKAASSVRRKRAPDALGAHPNTGHKIMQINVMDSVRFVQATTTDPAKFDKPAGCSQENRSKHL